MFDEVMKKFRAAGHKFQTLHSIVDELWNKIERGSDLLPEPSLLRL